MNTVSVNTISDRGFGIELEMHGATAQRVARELTAAGVETVTEDYNHTTRSHWKLVTDGSITDSAGLRTRYGLELVSPILYGADGLRQIRIVCTVLTRLGLKVNQSTGFHVHHGVADFGLKEWKMLLLQYLKHEKTVSFFLPTGRRQNRYCKPLRSRWATLEAGFAELKAAATVEELMAAANGYDRFHTVNVQNWSLRGTVEFRQHCGTLDADKVISWVLLTQAMVEYAKILRYFEPKGADSKTNLFAFRRYFPEPARLAVDGLTRHFNDNRAQALTAAMER